MRTLFMLCLFSFTIFSVYSQEKNYRNQLYNKIQKNEFSKSDFKTDTSLIRLCIELGDSYEKDIPDSALFFYEKANKITDKVLSEEADNVFILKQKARAIRYIGIVHLSSGKLEKANDLFNEAMNIYEKTNDQEGVSQCLINIGSYYRIIGDYNTAIEFMNKALKKYEGLKSNEGISNCYSNIGVILKEQGDFSEAKEYYDKAVSFFIESGDKRGLSACYNNIAGLFTDEGKYEDALDFYFKALKLKEELNDKRGIASAYIGIGNIQYLQASYEKAIEYYENSMKIYEEIGDKYSTSICIANIGNIFYEKGEYEKAVSYFQKTLNISYELNDIRGELYANNNIGNVLMEQGDLHQALKYFKAALDIAETIEDKYSRAAVSGNIADIHLILSENKSASKHLDTALTYGIQAINAAYDINSADLIYTEAGILQAIYRCKGDYKKALEYAEIFISTKDTIFSHEKTEALAEMSTKYESEKKQLQIDNLNKDNALKNSEIAKSEEKRKKQLILIWSFVLGFVIILIFSIIILQLFLQKKRTNIQLGIQKKQIELQNIVLQQANEEISAQRDEIAAQRDLVTEQKEHIEVQKKEIEDSIIYAKRIQNSVLPSESQTSSLLGEHFILFKPKDVVSGDFYWAAKKEEWTLIAVADCTGHGVPGAFMSMLGISFLNEIIRKIESIDTATILNELRKSIIESLRQTGTTETSNESSSVKDGMDISLLALSPKNQLHRRAIKWSGAYNGLYLVSNNNHIPNNNEKGLIEENEPMIQIELSKIVNNSEIPDFEEGRLTNYTILEIKPDKMPVAIHEKMDDFACHNIELKAGDRVFLFSDGYADQFGGSNGKKLKYKTFRELILNSSSLPMHEQKKFLEQEIYEWMHVNGKNYEQVDDITVVGLQI